MIEDEQFAGQGRVGIRIESTSFSVAPGGSVTFPILLLNRGPVDDFLELTVRGIPSNWVFMPSPVIRLASGEQREVTMTIQPPPPPQGRVGRYPIVMRATSQESPDNKAEVEGTLTVAAFEVQGRIGILLASTEFSVVPGSSTTIPIVLLNQGLEDDHFQLAVQGIPTTWVSTPSAVTRLSPGQQAEVFLTIQPPRSTQSQAGRHSFKIQVISQAAPGQMAEADCTLTVAVFSQFSTELHPQQVEAGEPARVVVENRGNIQQAFSLTWQSPNDELTFEPGPVQELRVPASQVAMAEFRASPRKRPFFGGEVTFPFATRVQSADKEAQNLRGEVISRALIPKWVVPVVLVAIMALACIAVLGLLGGESFDVRPTKTLAPEITPEADTPMPTQVPPEVPTEEPPVEPTEPPPVEPTEPPPVEPTEPPPVEPTEPPPVEPTEPPGEGQGPDLPCLPVAFSIVLVPLLLKRTS